MSKDSVDVIKIQRCINDFEPFLYGNDLSFLRRVYQNGIDIYLKRVIVSGFEAMDKVLDAGCGFGQWSLALCKKNNEIFSVDISTKRILFFKELVETLNVKNISISVSSIYGLKFADGFFDAIFCYGVIFLSPWKKTLKEFSRVLKPGGKVYLSANGFGWYKNLWFNQPNKTTDYDPQLVVAKVLYNTWKYNNGYPVDPGIGIIIQTNELKTELQRNGFTDIQIDSEGCLRSKRFENEQITPFFNGCYDGDLGVYEVLASKR